MKAARHEAILRIIRERPVATQEELARSLAAMGMNVTQATVSRDVRDLGLVKASHGSEYRYAEPPQSPGADPRGRLKRTLADFVRGIERSGNLVVLKTSPGTANAVAASIDETGFPQVLGTLAGDDVVLVIVRFPSEEEPPSPAASALEAEFRWLCGHEKDTR